mgnify:CR=1 FL=1|jgi:hypothetical protein
MNKQIIKDTTHAEKVRITKTSYEEIAKSIKDWPQWKKNLCNQELIVSVNAKKI